MQDFLWYLLKHLRGHVIVVWDGTAIHNRKGLQAFCHPYPRLHLEKLPAYAPELNPIEAAWHATKHPLANGQPDNIPQLGRALLASLRNARASQRVLRGCIRQSDLSLFCLSDCITYETVSRSFQMQSSPSHGLDTSFHHIASRPETGRK